MGKTPKRKQPRALLILSLALLLLAIIAALIVCLGAIQFRNADHIAPNVTVAGVPVAGLSSSEAQHAVATHLAAKLPDQVRLRYGHGTITVPRRRLGAALAIAAAVRDAQRVAREGSLLSLIVQHVNLRRKGLDVPVRATVDSATLERFLRDISPIVRRIPRNADIRVVGEHVEVIPGKPGSELDIPASKRKLEKALTDPSLAVTDLVVKTQEPAISAEDLSHLEVVLSRYTTRYRTWQKDRTHNLRLAIANLSRAVLMPGDTLSLNERIGPRLSERGFRSAPIFINGEVEPSTGGGVCQVATTVYNAALLAGLDIVERHHHSRPVDYAPSGRDATVYWGQFDLKIRNNLAHPILLLGDIDGGSMTVRILGSRSDKLDVEITRSGISRIPFGTKEVPDPTLELNKRVVDKPGRAGTRVTVSRTIKRSDRVLKTECLHTDVYSPQTAIVRVGTKPPVAPLPTAPGALPGQPGAPSAAKPPATPGPTTPARPATSDGPTRTSATPVPVRPARP